MDEAGIQPAQNASVAQTGFVVHAKIEKLFTCGSAFRQPWFLIPLFALAGCFLTLCSRFSLDLFAKWACRRSCFLQHAPFHLESGNVLLSRAFPPALCFRHWRRAGGNLTKYNVAHWMGVGSEKDFPDGKEKRARCKTPRAKKDEARNLKRVSKPRLFA